MDAQVAYGFHHLRDEKPWLARGRTANQVSLLALLALQLALFGAVGNPVKCVDKKIY